MSSWLPFFRSKAKDNAEEEATDDPASESPADSARRVRPPGVGVRPITYRDMAFIPTNDTYWIESLTVTAFLANGDFMLYSFVVSNIPFSKRRATANLKINPHDGSPATYYQSSYNFKHIVWSDDRCSAQFPDGSFFRYNDQVKSVTIRVTNDNKASTLNLFQGAAFVQLDFLADVKTGMQLGAVLPLANQATNASSGPAEPSQAPRTEEPFLFEPRQHPSNFTFPKEKKFWRQANFPVGSISVRAADVSVDAGGAASSAEGPNLVERASGTGYVGRMTTNVAIHRFCSDVRHLKVYSEDRRMALVMLDLQCSKKYAFETLSLCGLCRDGELIMLSQQCKFTKLEPPEVDPETGYRPPKLYSVICEGPSVDGSADIKCELTIRPKKLMERIHVLGHLPGVLRWLVEKIMAKPIFYVYKEDPGHVSVNVTITPRVPTEPTEIEETPSPTDVTDAPELAEASGGAEKETPLPAASNVETFSFTGPCMHEAHFMFET